MWQAGVLELPEAIVSGLIDGKLWTYRIPFNERLYQALLAKAKEFWAYVQKKEPPPFVPGQGARWISEAYRSQEDEDLVEAPADKAEDMVHAVETYLAAAEAKKRAELDCEAAKGYLGSVIQRHAGLALPGYRVTWKQDRPSVRTDWEGVARQALEALSGVLSVEELDAIVSTNTKEKQGARRFLIKKEK